MEWSSAQILVVVAIIQISTLNTEADKGSKTTAFDLGLVAPKGQGNSVNRRWPQGRSWIGTAVARKGNGLKFLYLALSFGRKALTSRCQLGSGREFSPLVMAAHPWKGFVL